MSALSVALLHIKMAQAQIGEPLNATDRPQVFPSDPLVNLERALALIQAELALIRLSRTAV